MKKFTHHRRPFQLTDSHNNNVYPFLMPLTGVKLDEVLDFSGGDIYHDGVVDLGERVRIADGTAVVCGDIGDSLSSNTYFAHTAELVLQHI